MFIHGQYARLEWFNQVSMRATNSCLVGHNRTQNIASAITVSCLVAVRVYLFSLLLVSNIYIYSSSNERICYGLGTEAYSLYMKAYTYIHFIQRQIDNYEV